MIMGLLILQVSSSVVSLPYGSLLCTYVYVEASRKSRVCATTMQRISSQDRQEHTRSIWWWCSCLRRCFQLETHKRLLLNSAVPGVFISPGDDSTFTGRCLYALHPEYLSVPEKTVRLLDDVCTDWPPLIWFVLWLYIFVQTKQRGRLVSTPAPHFGGFGLKPGTGPTAYSDIFVLQLNLCARKWTHMSSV
jgi:hypothetical protein